MGVSGFIKYWEIKMEIVTLGEILIDMFPAEVGRPLVEVSGFRPKPGGAPANVAVAASRLGARTAFIGKVGKDAFGDHLIEVLQKEGVDTRGMRVSEAARTTMAIIAMPDENTAEFVFYRNPGADLLLRIDELEDTLLHGTLGAPYWFVESRGGTQPQCDLRSRPPGPGGGALISFDVNFRPSLWELPEAALGQIQVMVPMVDLVKVNEIELALLQGQDRDPAAATRAVLDQGPTVCVLTQGKTGSFCRTVDEFVMVPAFEVKTVDATGCGDAFIAGVLTQFTRSAEWKSNLTRDRLIEILRYGNAVGALTAQTLGVIPALPTAAQVEEFLTKAV